MSCRTPLAALAALAWLSFTHPALSQEPVKVEAPRDVKSEVPSLAYAYSAYGASARSLGAQVYGLAAGASSEKAQVGGGITIWGSPVDRLTLVGDGSRNVYGNFSPSVAAIFRAVGKAREGWSLGLLGKFKVDGFAGGPTKDEMESEIETGLLLSYAHSGWLLDANAIAGFGTGDDGEVDVEGRLRVGRMVGQWVRLGLDGQARLRVAGPRLLPNKKTWDFSAGPQVVVGNRYFFGTLTAGPATMGLFDEKVGVNAMVSVGGSTL